MKIRIVYNCILNLIGIREMLPGEIVRSKRVVECGEPMILITPSDGLYIKGNYGYCRESVAKKLISLSKTMLEEGLGIYIFELYRSAEEQEEKYKKTYNLYSKTIKNKDELERAVRKATAGVGGGHQTCYAMQ